MAHVYAAPAAIKNGSDAQSGKSPGRYLVAGTIAESMSSSSRSPGILRAPNAQMFLIGSHGVISYRTRSVQQRQLLNASFRSLLPSTMPCSRQRHQGKWGVQQPPGW